MSLTPTSLTPTADPAVFLVPEDYQAGTLAVLVAGVFVQPGVDYDAAGDGDRTVTFVVAPSGWVAGTWVTQAGFGAGTYLSTALLQARLGGHDRYLDLTDDDGDGTPDPDVESYLLTFVDSLVDGFARRGGYTTPLGADDIEPILPFLLNVANYMAVTRAGRAASADDTKLYNDAMKELAQIATGSFKLPSYQSTSPITEFGFDSDGDANGGPFFSRETLRSF